MAKFTDNQGRKWVITLADADAITEIRKDADPLFLIGEPGETFQRMENDPVLVCNLIYLFCKEQVTAANLSQKDFYSAVIGDAIEGAINALTEAIIDFFPPKKRAVLKALASKTAALNELGAKAALDRINDPNLEKELIEALESKMDEGIERFLTRLKSAGSVPASVELVQTV